MRDSGVQSLRVASALCDRFAELLKGPQSVSMTRNDGALFGVSSGSEEALSLRIGESQQIYPEIWRHLDDARNAFASRGVDVSAYDQIRAQEGNAIGANVQMKTTGYGDAEHIVKSANFNREGFARARKASEALMRATPEIDWAGIAKAEAEDPAVAAFNASTKRNRWIKFGLLGLLIASPFIYVGNTCRKKQAKIDERREAYEASLRLTDSEKQRLTSTITEAKQALAESRKQWAAVTTAEALAAIAPGTGACEYRFQAPSVQAADSFVKHGSIDGNYFGRSSYQTFPAGTPPTSDALGYQQETVDEVAKKHAAGTADRNDAERIYRLESHFVFIVVERQKDATVTDLGADVVYMPGELAGRAYVFSAHAKKIVCAAMLDVKNSTLDGVMLRTQYGGGADAGRAILQRDMDVQIRRALAVGLSAVD